jgi:hypothetical protein
MAMSKDKMVDKVVSKVSPGYAMDMDREHKWKVDGALSDIMRAEGHKADKELMGNVKKRVKGVAKALGCMK